MTQPTSASIPNDTRLSLPKANRVDYTDSEVFTRFLSGIASAFASTSLTRAFITEIDNTPPPYPSPLLDKARIIQHFSLGITSVASQNGILLEAGDFSALAVWETTKYTGLPFAQQMQNITPIRGQWRQGVHELKAKHLGTRTNEAGEEILNPHYHLGFLARNPEVPQVAGSISAVIRPMLEEAVKEGVPVWLEATYEHAVAVYEHYGFRTVEILTVGAGSRNMEGWPEEGGVGTKGWAMIFDGHLQARVNKVR